MRRLTKPLLIGLPLTYAAGWLYREFYPDAPFPSTILWTWSCDALTWGVLSIHWPGVAWGAAIGLLTYIFFDRLAWSDGYRNGHAKGVQDEKERVEGTIGTQWTRHKPLTFHRMER